MVKAANNYNGYQNKELKEQLEKANEALNNEVINKDPITPKFKYKR